MRRHFPVRAFSSADPPPKMTVEAETIEEARAKADQIWPWAKGYLRVVDGCRPDLPGGCGGEGCNGTLVRVPWQEGDPAPDAEAYRERLGR